MLTDFGGEFDSAWGGVVTMHNGEIVAGGCVNSASVWGGDFGLARYEPDGSLDQTFGQGGTVATGIDNHSGCAFAMVRQPNDKIVLAGAAIDGLAMARYEPDGSLDTTFGTDGIVIDGMSWGAQGLTLRPDGRLVAVGRANFPEPGSDVTVSSSLERGILTQRSVREGTSSQTSADTSSRWT